MTKEEIQKNGEHWYNKYKDAEKRIADIKANCDLAIEGRDIKIKELEKENAKLKEQLDFIRDERNYFQEKCEDIELNYYCDHKGGCKVQELEQQIEKMQCCENCAFFKDKTYDICHRIKKLGTRKCAFYKMM